MEMVTIEVDVSLAAAKKCAKLAGVNFTDWRDAGGETNEHAKMQKLARKFFTDGLNNYTPKKDKKKKS